MDEEAPNSTKSLALSPCGESPASAADGLAALQRQRLRSALTGLPPALLLGGGGLRRQAEQRTLQQLGRSRRAAMYRPHLRAAATAALTAAEQAFARLGPSDESAAVAARAAAEAGRWATLSQLANAHRAQAEQPQEAEVERRRRGKARGPGGGGGGAAAAAARGPAAATGAGPAARAGPDNLRLFVRESLTIVEEEQVAARLHRLAAAARAGGGGATSDGGGDGSGDDGGGGNDGGGGGGGRASRSSPPPPAVSMLQGMCLGSQPATLAPDPDPAAAALPGRAAFLVGCLVDAWEAELPEGRGLLGARERAMEAAVAVTEALVRFHGGPRLLYCELQVLAILLCKLQSDSRLLAVAALAASGGGGGNVGGGGAAEAYDNPFAGARCPLEGHHATLTSTAVLCRLVRRIARIGGDLPAARGAGGGGGAAAAAAAEEKPAPLVVLLSAVKGVANAIAAVIAIVSPHDSRKRLAAMLLDVAEHVRRTGARVQSQRGDEVGSLCGRIGGGRGPDVASAAEAVAGAVGKATSWLRDIVLENGAGGGCDDDGDGGGGSDDGDGDGGGGRGGGGGGDSPLVLRSWELGRLAVRTRLARALLGADAGESPRQLVAVGREALLRAVVFTCATSRLRCDAQVDATRRGGTAPGRARVAAAAAGGGGGGKAGGGGGEGKGPGEEEEPDLGPLGLGLLDADTEQLRARYAAAAAPPPPPATASSSSAAAAAAASSEAHSVRRLELVAGGAALLRCVQALKAAPGEARGGPASIAVRAFQATVCSVARLAHLGLPSRRSAAPPLRRPRPRRGARRGDRAPLAQRGSALTDAPSCRLCAVRGSRRSAV